MRRNPDPDHVPHFMSSSSRRLVSELRTFRHEFEGMQRARPGKAPDWVRDVRRLLGDSERAWRRGNRDLAWREFRGARRLAILGFPEERLEKEASALMYLAKDLPDNLEKAIAAHLKGEDLKGKTSREGLMRATKVRDEYYDDKYIANDLVTGQLWVILTITFGIMGAFVFLAWAGELNLSDPLNASNVGQLLAMILAGMLGGSLSALQSLMSVDKKTGIPDRLLIMRSTLLRSLIGGAAALATLFLLESGLFGDGPPLLGSMLSVAFAGGFTERFVMNAASKVTDRAGAKAKA